MIVEITFEDKGNELYSRAFNCECDVLQLMNELNMHQIAKIEIQICEIKDGASM